MEPSVRVAHTHRGAHHFNDELQALKQLLAANPGTRAPSSPR